MNRWKNGKAKIQKNHANPSGRLNGNTSCHAQRIELETAIAEYNSSTSHRHLEQVIMYAELMGNHKSQGIKSPWGNKLKELLDEQDVPMEMRKGIVDVPQYNDLNVLRVA